MQCTVINAYFKQSQHSPVTYFSSEMKLNNETVKLLFALLFEQSLDALALRYQYGAAPGAVAMMNLYVFSLEL